MDDVQRQRTNVLYAHLHDVRRSFVRLKRNIYRYGISEALLILNEKKKRKNSAEEKRPRKRPKYLLKGQTWRFAEKMREVPLQICFLSKKKRTTKWKKMSHCLPLKTTNTGRELCSVLLFLPRFWTIIIWHEEEGGREREEAIRWRDKKSERAREN